MSGTSIEKIIAGRWIAGPDLDDAVKRSLELNRKSIKTMINYLGEELTIKRDIRETVEQYIKIIDTIRSRPINSEISIKPTQIGLSISDSLFRINYYKILNFAKSHGVFVWLDMEESKYTKSTIDTYLARLKNYHNMGICIQAYLKRSLSDVTNISDRGGIIRLVKGAYQERSSSAYQYRREITKNYSVIMRYLFKNTKRFMLGTHDEDIIRKALRLNAIYKRELTYAMLNGINDSYAKRLAINHKSVSIYLPFGKRWLGYSYRRLKEANNIKILMRSVFSNM